MTTVVPSQKIPSSVGPGSNAAWEK